MIDEEGATIVKCLTGLQNDKLLFHFFGLKLWFNSDVVSMSLFGYELARAYQKPIL
jgi:hypothetical protein